MAQRKLNKNMVVVLTLFGLLAMLVVSIVAIRQLQTRDPKHFVALADDYAKKSQWAQAALLYRKAWERSNDPVHLVPCGRMFLQEGELNRAVAVWKQALIDKPDLFEAHREYIGLLFEISRLYGRPQEWSEVASAVDELLAVPGEKSDEIVAFAHHVRGVARTRLTTQDASNAESGLADLQRAVELAPANVDYAIDLAIHELSLSRNAQAEALLTRLQHQFTTPGAEATKIRLALARFFVVQGRTGEAEKAFLEGIKFAGDDKEAVRDANVGYAAFVTQQWARSMRESASPETTEPLFNQAEALLREAAKADPESWEPDLQLATLYKASRHYREMIDSAAGRLGRGFSRKGIEGTRNKLYAFGAIILASEGCLAVGVATDPVRDPKGRADWLARAESYVEQARGEFPSHPKLLSQSGRIKLALGRDREALENLRAAEEAYRSNNVMDRENTVILANLHLRLNEPGAARIVLEETIERQRGRAGFDTAFYTLYAQVLFQCNDYERAMNIAEQILLADSGNADARRIKAAIYERQSKHQQAGELVAGMTGSDVVRAVLKARELGLEGDVEGSLDVLREALKTNPADARLVGGLVNELLKLDRIDEAQGVAEQALRLNPDSAIFKRVAIAARKDLPPEQRDQAMLELIESDEDGYQRALNLVDFYARRGNPTKALKAIDQALQHLDAKDTPTAQSTTLAHPRALLTGKLQMAAKLNDQAAMESARDQAVKLNVDGAGGKSIVGLYHLARNETELAAKAFHDAVAAQPTDGRVITHLAQTVHALGKRGDAKTHYENAIRVNPNEAMAHRGLAIIALAEGDQDAYRKSLAVCERLIPTDPWVSAQIRLRKEQENPLAAIAAREAKLATSPDDVENLKRLTALSEGAGLTSKADTYVERLLHLQGGDEELAVAAARYFRRTQRPQRALDLLIRFAESKGEPTAKAEALVLVAGHHLAQNDPKAAEQSLLTAAELSTTQDVAASLAEFYLRKAGRPRDALAWFDKALEAAAATRSPQHPQLMASEIACLLHREINDTATARRVVDEFKRSFPNDPRGFLWESELQARLGRMDEAVKALSEYIRLSPNDPYGFFQRAQYLHTQGRVPEAIADLEACKRIDRLALELQPRILLAQFHEEVGQKDLAIHELESLNEDAPQAPRAAQELVRAYLRRNRLDDAERVVTARINREGDRADARWFFLRGQVALEQGDQTRAIQDFKRGAQIAEFSPEAVTQVLTLFAMTRRFAEGAEYFEALSSAGNQTAVLVSRYAALLAGVGRKAQAVDSFRKAMVLAMAESSAAIETISNDVQNSFALDEAISVFEGAVDTPLGRANNRILARLYRTAGRADDAAAKLKQLIETATTPEEHARLLHETGELYQVEGMNDRARQAYEEALKIDPNNWVTLNNLAYLLSDAMGEHKLARPYAERAVARTETSATLDTLGWIYVGLGEFSLAVAELSRAVRLDSEAFLTYYHLGEAYRRNRQFTEAAETLKVGMGRTRTSEQNKLVEQMQISLDRALSHDTAP